MSFLSKNIKYLRDTAGSSQAEFGKAFGVSRDNIASYERGTEPKIDFILKVVNFYHITVDNLIRDDLEEICEKDDGTEKLDLNNQTHSRPKLDLNNKKSTPNPNEAHEPVVSELYKEISRQMQLEFIKEIRTLTEENALLKQENTRLKAENARFKGGADESNKQSRSA